MLKIILLILIICIICMIIRMKNSVQNIQRIDQDGALYSLDYVKDYYNLLARAPYQLIRHFGCTAFMTHNEQGEVITCRNYDMPHFDKHKNLTGLNVVVHLNPKGKYASVNVADASWLTYLKAPYYKGCLDYPKKNYFFLTFLPYLCMDGINEKGLSCSILYLDIKAGEKPVAQKKKGLKVITINEMCRYIIDQCASCKEAIELAEKYNLHNIVKCDYHLFIVDASGKSCILEWRYNELKVTWSDACTNFYTGYDDGQDCYIRGELKEKFIQPEPKTREYHYGYGHGYERFAVVTKGLENHIDLTKNEYYTKMSEKEGMDYLSKASQQFNGMLTSYTQYSCVYNHTRCDLEIAVQMDYLHHYHFEINK